MDSIEDKIKAVNELYKNAGFENKPVCHVLGHVDGAELAQAYKAIAALATLVEEGLMEYDYRNCFVKNNAYKTLLEFEDIIEKAR